LLLTRQYRAQRPQALEVTGDLLFSCHSGMLFRDALTLTGNLTDDDSSRRQTEPDRPCRRTLASTAPRLRRAALAFNG
jgi:hypothetical protein